VVRTGSSQSGFYGAATLNALVPAAHAVGIAVIAWTSRPLSTPPPMPSVWRRPLRSGADGFGADIETASEGTYLTARRVAYYLSLGPHGSRRQTARRDRAAPHRLLADGLPLPNRGAVRGRLRANGLLVLHRAGSSVGSGDLGPRPAASRRAIGQDYDMAAEGGRPGLPSGREIWRFLDVADRSGAIGASLYDLESGGRTQLAALGRYPWPRAAPK